MHELNPIIIKQQELNLALAPLKIAGGEEDKGTEGFTLAATMMRVFECNAIIDHNIGDGVTFRVQQHSKSETVIEIYFVSNRSTGSLFILGGCGTYEELWGMLNTVLSLANHRLVIGHLLRPKRVREIYRNLLTRCPEWPLEDAHAMIGIA